MRFLQFLRENTQTERALLEVERLCADFIHECGSQVGPWRGFNRRFSLPDDHIIFVPEDRKPLDTRREIHDAMDDWFLDNFGFRARSNALFCTGSKSHASVYGEVHSIYAAGKYEYVWSPEVEDMIHIDELAKHTLAKLGMKDRNDDETLEQKVSIMIDVLEDSGYRGSGLREALKSGNEIMLRSEKYFVFDNKDPVWREWSGYKDTK